MSYMGVGQCLECGFDAESDEEHQKYVDNLELYVKRLENYICDGRSGWGERILKELKKGVAKWKKKEWVWKYFYKIG